MQQITSHLAIATNQHAVMIKTAVIKITPTTPPIMIPTTAPVERSSSDSILSEVGLTDGDVVWVVVWIVDEMVGKIVEDGVMIILDTTTISTVESKM